MAMSFADFDFAVGICCMRSSGQLAAPRTESHRATEFLHSTQLAQLVDHPMRSGRIEFARVGFGQSTNVACKLNAGRLHSQANSKVGNLVLASVTDTLQHACDSALAKSSRNEDAIELIELLL